MVNWKEYGDPFLDFTEELTEQWINNDFDQEQTKEWLNIGLKANDFALAGWFKNIKNKNAEWVLNCDNLEELLRKEYEEYLKTNEIKNQTIPAQTYLDWHYPQEKRKKIQSLYISGFDFEKWEENPRWTQLTGSLDCTDFVNLEYLFCDSNQLTSLNLTGLNKLKSLGCGNNLLTNLDFLTTFNPETLTHLEILDNNISPTNISVFSKFANLKKLLIGNIDKKRIDQGIYNRFYGSLEFLKGLTKLESLNIANTDINTGLEYLPTEKLEELDYFFDERPESKVQELRVDKEKVNALIYNNLQKRNIKEVDFIPYEQFSELKKIGEGGYGTVYQAKWKTISLVLNVALKILKKDVDKEVLQQEYANHELIVGDVLPYIGITQTPEGNYAIITYYCKYGTLRDYLTSHPEVTIEDKYVFLVSIIKGLQAIHNQGLVHKDFHTNNVLMRTINGERIETRPIIADLGLSIFYNEVESNNQLIGVLPYLAPEVLLGEPYTAKSDIYSFSMIMYETLTGYKPFHDENWNSDLIKNIALHDLRPEITVKMIPQFEEIIRNCWQTEPTKRPSAKEILEKFIELSEDNYFIKLLSSPEYNHPYQINLQNYPSVCWTSKRWNIVRANLEKLLISDEDSKIQARLQKQVKIQLLESQLDSLKVTITENQQEFLNQFVTLRKEFIKDKKTKKKEMKDFKETIKNDFSEELINEIEQICDELVELELEEKETYQTLVEQTINQKPI
jgi:serine/threonine protein kinase